MINNLTDYQLEVANWLAQQNEKGLLPETFYVIWESDKRERTTEISDFKGKQPKITFASLEILEKEELIQTIHKQISKPIKFPGMSKKNQAYTPLYQPKKEEVGRTYCLRNDIFKAKDLYLKRQLLKNAERILAFMINRPEGSQHGMRSEIKAALEMDDETYEKTCQFLQDYDLIYYKGSTGELWGYIGPDKRGRQVMHERSLENLILSQSPIVNFHQGDQINVTNTGENVAIAAGRQSNVTQSLTSADVAGLFQVVFQRLEQLNHPDTQKVEIRETIELIEGEVGKEADADEKALRHYFRTLAKMAPDILDVVIATATNPILGAATIVRKVAEKAKADAQGS